MDKVFTQVAEKIKNSERFMVVSHVNPEGDALGSLLGLALALSEMGKDVVAYSEDPVPETLRFLPGVDTLVHDLGGEPPFDVTFAVDCGQIERLGAKFAEFEGRGTLINVDHHATNDNFGDVNIVVPDASAAGEIVFDLLEAAGAGISPDVATNLYVAIVTDTGSFRYSSTSPGAFVKAGELVAYGASPWEVARHVYESYPASRFKLLSEVLSTLEVIGDDGGKGGGNGGMADRGIATVFVTEEMIKSAGANREDSDGFVNYTRSIKGVEVGVLFRQCGPDEYKVSLRAKGEVDVAAVAETFGGGGHSHAAGCNLSGSLEEVRERVVSALKESICVAGRG
ncbi:MAG: bifunctional oligoribonuclease/PAP phosphatase NrnA [Thermodesulfobacteriota bacterium]